MIEPILTRIAPSTRCGHWWRRQRRAGKAGRDSGDVVEHRNTCSVECEIVKACSRTVAGVKSGIID